MPLVPVLEFGWFEPALREEAIALSMGKEASNTVKKREGVLDPAD